MGITSEEFWFDSQGYLNSKATLCTLRSLVPVESFDCQITETTRMVSLIEPEADWVAQFTARTRASIRHGERNYQFNLSCEKSERETFFHAHQRFAAETGITSPNREEKEFLEIFLARDASGALLHGCAFLHFPTENLYRYRYSVALAKSQANPALIFAAMRRAKELNCHRFDLGGIVPAASPNSKEEKINFFKAQFGGVVTPVYFYLRSPNWILKWGLKLTESLFANHSVYRFFERGMELFSFRFFKHFGQSRLALKINRVKGTTQYPTQKQ
jgi:hypothetical protein